MSGAFDQNWYRVVGLKPRLRLHAELHRQFGRGGIWYVMKDNQTGRHFRVSVAGHAMLSMMDGRRSLGEIFARLVRHLGADRPSRGDAVQLLMQLHQSDLLATPLPPDFVELERRATGQTRRKTWATFRNPLALRLPLWSPDRFLTATAPFVRRLCNPLVGLVALTIVLVGAFLAVMHASELANNVADRVFAADNVLLLSLLYPVAKALHEAGHAYAVKIGGEDIPEVGFMLLVLFPVPYVDASASVAFPDAWRRILVSAAGMIVELVIAGAASIAWVLLDPGAARATALDLMVLCGASTLLFNGNPLLRFDGYYILCDLIAIPNLDTRARKELIYLMKRYLIGMPEEVSVVEAPGEGRWLVGFGLLSLAYRLVMVVSIALILATKLFFVGVALAIASILQMMLMPILRGMRFVAFGRELRGRRLRALGGLGGAALLIGALLFVVPFPHALVARGVVWVPRDAVVRADADGFVEAIVAKVDSDVSPGSQLFRLVDDVAAARVDVLAADVAVQRSRYDAVNQIDRVQARLAADQLARSSAAYARAREEIAGLDIRAARSGRFIVPYAESLSGRFVRKGDTLGYVLGGDDVTVHAVVPQAELDQARARTARVTVLLSERMSEVLPARVVRETPSALDEVPAPALAAQGGGPMLVDPTSRHRSPLDRWYEFDVAPIEAAAGTERMALRIGQHASVRFDLGTEPIAWRLARWTRQLILKTVGL